MKYILSLMLLLSTMSVSFAEEVPCEGYGYVTVGTNMTAGTEENRNRCYTEASDIFCRFSDDGDYSNDDFRLKSEGCDKEEMKKVNNFRVK
jgi:hypothetical protein